MKDLAFPLTIGAIFVALIVLTIVAGCAEAKQKAAWIADCQSQGGHVISKSNTATGTGLSPKGEIVTTTTEIETDFCLSSDGRVLGVR